MILFDKPKNICVEHSQPFWTCPECGNKGCNLGLTDRKCNNYAFNQGTCLRCSTYVPGYHPNKGYENKNFGYCNIHKRDFVQCPKCGNKGCNVDVVEQNCDNMSFKKGFCLQCNTHIFTYREW